MNSDVGRQITGQNQTAVCLLCPHHCRLKPGQKGRCHVRGNREGEIVSLTYGELAAWHLDPIEKKPLFHFYPGSEIFSVAGYGCNLTCNFCQNHEISQTHQVGKRVTPVELAEMTNDSLGICFTYSEPSVWFEMIRDTVPLIKEKGGKVVFVSNGMIEADFLEQLIPWLDAVNIDIKGFREDFYQDYCGGKLSWVLETVQRLSSRVHIEITTLIIPGANDDPSEIRALAKWLEKLGSPIAWHLSRYFPAYRSSIPATNPETLLRLGEIAKDFLPYVYLGNVVGGHTTFCPKCGTAVIYREREIQNLLQNGHCPTCSQLIFGVGI